MRRAPKSRRRFRRRAENADVVFTRPRFVGEEPPPDIFVHGYTSVELDEDLLHRCVARRLEGSKFDIASAIDETLEKGPRPKGEKPVRISQPLMAAVYFATA